MPADGSESVLVIDAARLDRIMMMLPSDIPYAVFSQVMPPQRDGFLANLLGDARFVPRTEALERDETLRQVIPYTLVRRDDGCWLWYERPAKNGEARLAGKRSVGWAGHVNTDDLPAYAREEPGVKEGRYAAHAAHAVQAAVARELAEEAGLNTMDYGSVKLLGLLDDRRDPVGRVHVGLIHAVRLNPMTFPRTDPAEVAVWGWADGPDLAATAADPDRPWESWSALLLPVLARWGRDAATVPG